jgi:methionine-rich copper-binding protein CopC
MTRHRLLGRSVVALAAAGLAMLAFAGPASAHDRLVSSDPADGSTVTEQPAAITLVFSDEVLATGTEVVVTTGGAPVDVGTPTVDGDTVSVLFPADAPAGGYDVDWRVVSADGHPVEGAVAFTLDVPAAAPSPAPAQDATQDATQDPAGATPDATPDATADTTQATETPAAAAPVDAATGSSTASPSPAPLDGPTDRSPLIVLIAGVAVVGTVVALVLRRRNGTRGFGPPGQD